MKEWRGDTTHPVLGNLGSPLPRPVGQFTLAWWNKIIFATTGTQKKA